MSTKCQLEIVVFAPFLRELLLQSTGKGPEYKCKKSTQSLLQEYFFVGKGQSMFHAMKNDLSSGCLYRSLSNLSQALEEASPRAWPPAAPLGPLRGGRLGGKEGQVTKATLHVELRRVVGPHGQPR